MEGERVSDRIPPHDERAERAVVGCVLLDERVLASARTIITDPLMFYHRKYGMIFYSMCCLRDAGTAIDAVTLANELKRRSYLEKIGGMTALSDLADDVATVTHLTDYAEIVRDTHGARKVMYAAQEVVALGYAATDVPREYVTESRAKVVAAARQGEAQEGIVSALTGITEAYNNVTSKDPPREVIHIGLGGQLFERGVVHILAGRPSSGKSVTAMNIVDNVAGQQLPCMVFNLEDAGHRWFRRQLSKFSKVPVTALRDKQIGDEDHPALINAANRFSQLPIWETARKGVTVEWIRATAAAHNEAHDTALIVIDYGQLIRGAGRNKDDQTAVLNDACHQLLSMAEELDAAVLLLSQMRKPEKAQEHKVPSMFELKQTSAFEQVAKWIGIMHYPIKHDDTASPNDLEMHIGKQSDGPTGMRSLHCDMTTMYVGNPEASGGYDQGRDGHDY